jgi:predicted dehydrogenase
MHAPAPLTTPPLRVGLIGYGFASKVFHAPLIQATPGLDLVAVSSRDAAKVHADLSDVAVMPDAAQLMARSDIDLIVVATPNDSHAPLTIAALHQGKHVVCDKPFTLTVAQAREVIAVADARQRQLTVFHNRRWDSDFLGVKQAINSGRLGRITHFESHIDRFRPAVRERWREQATPGAGLWFDLGPHLVDQALQLFGLPDAVTASLATQRTGAVVDDWAHVVMAYGPMRVVLQCSALVAGGAQRFTVHGEHGSVTKPLADRQEAQLLAGIRPGDPTWGHDPDPLLLHDGSGQATPLPAPAGDQREIYMQVAAAMRGEAPNPVPPLQALAVMAVIEAAADSAREGRTVQLDLTEAERAAWA